MIYFNLNLNRFEAVIILFYCAICKMSISLLTSKQINVVFSLSFGGFKIAILVFIARKLPLLKKIIA